MKKEEAARIEKFLAKNREKAENATRAFEEHSKAFDKKIKEILSVL